jgi:hypothetical protein
MAMVSSRTETGPAAMSSRRRVGSSGAKLGQLGDEGDEAGDGAERRALAETVLATLCCSGG